MNDLRLAAAILSVGLIVGAFLISGRFVSHEERGHVYVVDRFTGSVRVCIAGEGCSYLVDESKVPPTQPVAAAQAPAPNPYAEFAQPVPPPVKPANPFDVFDKPAPQPPVSKP